ncbi:MAG: D-inositol-3-phosphate glycosyltransferase [Micromonosporaceae bacterium]|nr:D-inositol-3-phosphate glycosyltransferase [Micromonosporaceae bacterium]
MHTSPLEQPGTGDAGGMNVYIVEVSKRLAEAGVEVEIFTRATSSDQPPVAELAPGVTVRHVMAGPYEGLSKEDLPAQLCGFTAGVLRAEAARRPGWYDLLHTHYWLSGQAGWLAKERWGAPLVHTPHTLAKVKNALLADGDTPEPRTRVIGEEQVVAESDRLVANTDAEATQLANLYHADPEQIAVVAPGADLSRFSPGSRRAARRLFGLPENGPVLLFVGRIQPLKAPDVVIRALAALRERDPDLARNVTAVICGGPSGTGLERPTALQDLADTLGVRNAVRFLPPQPADRLASLYRAADLLCMPSYNESFGLVALEAQACGTPVLAAAVGGLVTTVSDGVSGTLVDGHDPADWATVIGRLLADPGRCAELGQGAVRHAENFSWQRTVHGLLAVYGQALSEHRARRLELVS